MRAITNAAARLIASEWHGGQGSALYAFSSTGVSTDSDLPRAIREINSDMAEAEEHDRNLPGSDETQRLTWLREYLEQDARIRGIEV